MPRSAAFEAIAHQPVTNSRSRELADWFVHHPPHGDQAARYTEIRALCGEMATSLCLLVPDGEELRMALSRLREVMMWSNAGVACLGHLLRGKTDGGLPVEGPDPGATGEGTAGVRPG